MLQTKLKAFLAIVCAIACVVGFSQGALLSATADDKPSKVALETTTLPAGDVVIENANLRFTFNQRSCFFTVEDLKTGKVWNSNPGATWDTVEDEAVMTDTVAKGKSKMELATTIVVHYLNKNEVADTAVSYTNSVKANKHKVQGIVRDGKTVGVRIDFHFDYEGFDIPIELELTEDRLAARVIAEEIKEAEPDKNGKLNHITAVEVLPYFGAGSAEDEGYILVPDGTGALINFNNNKSRYAAYSQVVYGRDVTELLVRQEATLQNAYLPVFGIKNGDTGLLGVITDNSSATILANVNGGVSSYNNARVSFRMRGTDSYTLGTTIGSRVQQFLVYEDGGINIDKVEVAYFFLTGEDSDYSGMAKRYRQYLIDECGMSVNDKQTTRVFLELYGGVEVTRPVMGFQTDVIQKVTGYDEAEKMLKDLKAAGVNDITVRYVNWDNNTIRGKAGGKVSLLSDLGGKKAFASLVAYCNNNGIELFLDQEMQRTNKWGNGYASTFHGAQTISGNLSKDEQFSIQLRFEQNAYQLMSMQHIPDIRASVEKTFGKLTDKYGNVGISTGSFGQILYSDYRTEGWTRNDSEQVILDTTAKLAETYPVMASGANLPAALQADVLVNLPVSSGRFDITDVCVPFYQLVMSGAKTYTASAANMSASTDVAVLQALETGSMVSFLLTEADYDELRDTKLTDLYSIGYDKYKDELVAAYQTLTDVYAKTEHSAVAHHEYLQTNVAKVVYENGTVIYINYTDEAIDVEGTAVAANSYAVKGGN